MIGQLKEFRQNLFVMKNLGMIIKDTLFNHFVKESINYLNLKERLIRSGFKIIL